MDTGSRQVQPPAGAMRSPAGNLTTYVAAAISLSSLVVVFAGRWGDFTQGMGWTTGDWLINYAGGFVRRGLAGEIILRVPLEPLAVVAFIQILTLTTIYASAFALFLRTSRSWTWLALCYSPAFLLFFPLNVEGAMRKETVALAVVALLAAAFRFRWHPMWWIAILGAWTLGAFTHETAILVSPILVYLIFLAMRQDILTRNLAAGAAVAVMIATVVALVLTSLASGTPSQASAICDRLVLEGLSPNLCLGAIEALPMGLVAAVEDVIWWTPQYTNYAGLAVLALVPFAMVGIRRQLWVLTGITYLFAAPLFVTGLDYGRWILLVTASMSLVILAAWSALDLREHRTPFLFAVAFLTLWSLPYTGTPVMESIFTRAFLPVFEGAITVLDSVVNLS